MRHQDGSKGDGGAARAVRAAAPEAEAEEVEAGVARAWPVSADAALRASPGKLPHRRPQQGCLRVRGFRHTARFRLQICRGQLHCVAAAAAAAAPDAAAAGPVAAAAGAAAAAAPGNARKPSDPMLPSRRQLPPQRRPGPATGGSVHGWRAKPERRLVRAARRCPAGAAAAAAAAPHPADADEPLECLLAEVAQSALPTLRRSTALHPHPGATPVSRWDAGCYLPARHVALREPEGPTMQGTASVMLGCLGLFPPIRGGISSRERANVACSHMLGDQHDPAMAQASAAALQLGWALPRGWPGRLGGPRLRGPPPPCRKRARQRCGGSVAAAGAPRPVWTLHTVPHGKTRAAPSLCKATIVYAVRDWEGEAGG
eukprot:363937-Chlamydomonas_euryale.AAC.14